MSSQSTTRQAQTRQPLSLREARTIAGLAAVTSLTASAAVGAGTHAAVGPGAGVAAGVVMAVVTLWAASGAVRVLVTCPRD